MKVFIYNNYKPLIRKIYENKTFDSCINVYIKHWTKEL